MDGLVSPIIGDSPLRTKLQQPKPTSAPKIKQAERKKSIHSPPKENTLVLITPYGTRPLSISIYDKSRTGSLFDQEFIPSAFPLGTGSFGEVYSAEWLADKMTYAVKVSLKKVRSESTTKYLEAQNHMYLGSHNNIVRYVRAWEDQGKLHIQTELCFMSLDTYLEKKLKLPEENAWHILIDVLMGLHHMHSNGMIHNDIKPENILMTKDSVCKIGDFGLAIKLNNAEEMKTDEEGDNRYLASEVIEQGERTMASDVFSLGVTTLEVATNLRVPRNGSGWQEIRNGQIPEYVFEDVSEEMRDLIEKMLSINPSERPTTKELLDHPEIKRRLGDRVDLFKNCTAAPSEPTEIEPPVPIVESSTTITPITPPHRPTSQPTFQSPVRRAFAPSTSDTPTTSKQRTQTRYSEASEEENLPCQQRAQLISRSSSDEEQQQPMTLAETPKRGAGGARRLERIPTLNFDMSDDDDEPESPIIKRVRSFVRE